MNIKLNLFSRLIYLALSILVITSCNKAELSESFDIDFPVPIIDTMSSVKDTVGKMITITGQNFVKLSSVSIGNPAVVGTIVSNTETKIVFQLPRVFSAGPITVNTLYKKIAVSKGIFTPIYLDMKVTKWPNEITRGVPISIMGSNMDLITEVDVNGTKVAVAPGKSSVSQLLIPTTGMTLPDMVIIKITKSLGKIENGTSPSIKVMNAGSFFKPELPIVLYDFEDGVDPFADGSMTPTHGINVGGLPSAGRGTKYLTVKAPTVADKWGTYIGGFKKTNIDVSSFHKPCFTFLVNTNGKEGYFQLGIKQAGKLGGTNFTKNSTGVDGDDYKFKTTGWEWRSIPLDVQLDDWGSGGYKFDKNKLIEVVELVFKQGNGSNPYEIHLDQIMITDGGQMPVFNAFNFEDNANPYNGSATSGINLSGVEPISGAKYLTIRKSNVGKNSWTGDIYKGGPVNLATVKDAHINFWINTNGNKGFLKIETFQDGTKWGGNLNSSDYFVQTNGWKLYSLRLSEIGFGNWGGPGTELNTKGVLDYIKIGFDTGNVEGAYEVNLDDVILSDGPMF